MRIAAVKRHGRRATAAIGVLTASLAMAACGGGGGMKEGPAAPAAAKEATGATVDMVDLAFKPRALTIERGQTVTFRNRGKVTHNAKGSDFFSRVVQPGGTYEHRFDEAGSFKYVCTFHPGMEGKLTVR